MVQIIKGCEPSSARWLTWDKMSPTCTKHSVARSHVLRMHNQAYGLLWCFIMTYIELAMDSAEIWLNAATVNKHKTHAAHDRHATQVISVGMISI